MQEQFYPAAAASGLDLKTSGSHICWAGDFKGFWKSRGNAAKKELSFFFLSFCTHSLRGKMLLMADGGYSGLFF